MNCKDDTRTTAEAWYRRHTALNDTSPELERHCPLWINELCQPCCITAERTEYVEKSLGIWLAHAASPPPLPSLDLHSWHKLLLQCNLSSSTEFDKNSWVFCIFMCLVKCRLLERNQHPSGRKAGARWIRCEEPERFVRSLPSLPWLAFRSLIKIWIKQEWNTQPKLSSKRCTTF